MTRSDLNELVERGSQLAPRIFKRLSFHVDEPSQEVTCCDGRREEVISVSDFLTALPVLISENS